MISARFIRLGFSNSPNLTVLGRIRYIYTANASAAAEPIDPDPGVNRLEPQTPAEVPASTGWGLSNRLTSPVLPAPFSSVSPFFLLLLSFRILLPFPIVASTPLVAHAEQSWYGVLT